MALSSRKSRLRSLTGRYNCPAWQNRQPRMQPRKSSTFTRACTISVLGTMGGTACSNPEPMAPFFDLMIIGEGEEVNNEVLALFRQAQKSGWSKTQFLEAAAKIQGVLVPSFYVPHWSVAS